MKAIRFFLPILILLIFTGCGTYTISSNDLLNTGKRIVLKGEFGFRASRLTITNPYYGVDFVLMIDGNPVAIPSRHTIDVDVPYNMLADGKYLRMQISVIPPSNYYRSATRDWTVQTFSSSESWVIQVNGNTVSL